MTIDRSWTLFLDRDGVINRRIAGDYVRRMDQFEFLPRVKEALSALSSVFGIIIIVSNQQGVGKRIMSVESLEEIHRGMTAAIEQAGGRIDRVYYSPDLEGENSSSRKPNTGMAERAGNDFPAINFNRAFMVGDSLTDMHFGKRMGMTTVMLSADTSIRKENPVLVDHLFPDLHSFASWISGETGTHD